MCERASAAAGEATAAPAVAAAIVAMKMPADKEIESK